MNWTLYGNKRAPHGELSKSQPNRDSFTSCLSLLYLLSNNRRLGLEVDHFLIYQLCEPSQRVRMHIHYIRIATLHVNSPVWYLYSFFLINMAFVVLTKRGCHNFNRNNFTNNITILLNYYDYLSTFLWGAPCLQSSGHMAHFLVHLRDLHTVLGRDGQVPGQLLSSAHCPAPASSPASPPLRI